jgi:hypothetical protein
MTESSSNLASLGSQFLSHYRFDPSDGEDFPVAEVAVEPTDASLDASRITALTPPAGKGEVSPVNQQGWISWAGSKLWQAGASVVTKTGNAIKATWQQTTTPGSRVEVLGFGVDPSLPLRATRAGINWVRGVHAVTPDNVLEDLALFRQQLEESAATLPAIPEPELAAARPAPSEGLTLEEQKKVDALLAEMTEIENKEKVALLNNLTNFASFRIFHETILGRPIDGDSSLNHYNQFICSESPNAAFYAQYGFWAGLLARILLPIIQWIVSLVFSTRSDQITGVWAIKERLTDYLQNPANIRRETGTILQNISEYFQKLHVIYTDFGRGLGGTQPLGQYIRNRLDEDLEISETPRHQLYRDLNNWIVNLIEIKTGTPIIGCLLDDLISSFLAPILNRMRLVESAFETSLGTPSTPNPAFVYNLQKLVLGQIRELNEKLKNLDNDLTVSSQAEDDPERHLSLSNEEKERIQRLYQRLIRILPYQGKAEEEIADVLAAEQNPSTNKSVYERVEGRFVNWQEEISESLEGPLNDLFALLYGEFSKQDSRLKLWTKTLSAANDLFSVENQQAYTPEDLDQISTELKRELMAFTDNLLDRQFKTEARKKTRDERYATVVDGFTTAREQISTQLTRLRTTQAELMQISPSSQPDQANALLHQMHRDLRELFSISYNRLVHCKDQPHLSDAAKNVFAAQTQELRLQMVEMLTTFDTIKAQVTSTIATTPLHRSLQALNQRDIGTTRTALEQLQLNPVNNGDTAYQLGQVEQILDLQLQEAAVTATMQSIARLQSSADIMTTHAAVMEILQSTSADLEPTRLAITSSLRLTTTSDDAIASRLQGEGRQRLSDAITAQLAQQEQQRAQLMQQSRQIISNIKEHIGITYIAASMNLQTYRQRMEAALQKTEAITQAIQPPPRLAIDPFNQSMAQFEKKRVKAVIDQMIGSLQTLFTNPMHLEYLLLNGPIRQLTARTTR